MCLRKEMSRGPYRGFSEGISLFEGSPRVGKVEEVSRVGSKSPGSEG